MVELSTSIVNIKPLSRAFLEEGVEPESEAGSGRARRRYSPGSWTAGEPLEEAALEGAVALLQPQMP